MSRVLSLFVASIAVTLALPLAAPISDPTLVPAGCAPAPDGFLFSGLSWTVKTGLDDPDLNTFDARNVACDATGALHLQIAKRAGVWTAAEVNTTGLHGFGHYRFDLEGPLGALDPRVALGLFLYAEPDARSYHEIDMEYAKWNDTGVPIASVSVWPPLRHDAPSPDCPVADVRPRVAAGDLGHGLVNDLVRDPIHCTHGISPAFTGAASSHLLDWESDHVTFATIDGASGREVAGWSFAPRAPTAFVPQTPMQVHLNLYVLDGGPLDDQPVEVVVRAVRVP